MWSGTPYDGFGGRIETTMAESEPFWPAQPQRSKAPNVVVILADDLGFSDIGCFGSEIDTPHLDAIAAQGLRHANFRVTPLCSPTRAALMTGLNAHAAGVAFPTHVEPGFPAYTSELPLNQPTLAEVFRHNGYSTLMVGKWHLCREDDLSEAGRKDNWPLQRGFDQYYGFLEALTNFHHPHRLYEGNAVVEVDRYPEGYYLTDDLTDRAERMIRDVKCADPDKPLFLYFAHGAVHAPMHAKPADIVRYRGQYDCGWDVIRERRLERQIESGLLPPETQLPPRNDEEGHAVDAWDSLSADEQRIAARYMEVYAAMVDNLDQSVGRLRAVLEEFGQLDDTIFIFTSDNGAARLTDAGRSATPPATTTDTGTPAYFGYIQDPGRHDEVASYLLDDLEALGGPRTWPHYPRGWAMACNTPFRMYKFSTLRGGQQAPFVMSWPRGMPGTGATVRRQYTHVTDILPTLVELLDLSQPAGREGRPAGPIAGSSFVSVLRDENAAPTHREQYTECVGNRSFYRDGWEAATVRVPMTPFSKERWQLFHESDASQAQDLSARYPEKVQELIEAFDVVAWQNQVYPMDEGSGLLHLQKPVSSLPHRIRIPRGAPTVERHRCSHLIHGHSWSATIDWRYRYGDEGILVAHGEQGGGYMLFVENGGLYFEQNQYGKPARFGPISLGDESQSVVLDVAAPGGRVWNVSLVVDGERTSVADGLPAFGSFLPFDGIDVGLCRRSPVSWDLFERCGTFEFSGSLSAVTYERGEPSADAPEFRVEQARAMGLGLQ